MERAIQIWHRLLMGEKASSQHLHKALRAIKHRLRQWVKIEVPVGWRL